MAEMSFRRQSTERIQQERPIFTTRELLDSSIASVLQDSTECISHELLHLVTRSRMKSVAVQTRLRVAGEAGSHLCARCTERRQFPLRAYTNVHHDRSRPEVAAA